MIRPDDQQIAVLLVLLGIVGAVAILCGVTP